MLSLRGYARVWSINFRVQVVMLVMLVKPADTSPHKCASTYFQTGLRTFLNICRVQSFVEHPGSVHTSANLIFHFSNKNGKRTYYLSLSYCIFQSTEKKRKRENGQENRSFFHFSNFEVKFENSKNTVNG